MYPRILYGLGAVMLALVLAQPVQASVLGLGGDRLVATQNADGGWGWPLTGVSAPNTVGPIAMGLAQAYLATGDASYLPALNKAGAFLLGKTNNFSPSDGYLAAQLDQIFGGTTYRDHVRTYFYDELAAGTYDRKGLGTLYDTAGYVSLIDTARANSGIANLAAWDIGIGVVGAARVGADTSAWIAGTKNEIDQLDGSAWYDVIGLAGAIIGLAEVGEDFDPTAGEHAAASSLDDLGAILASYQIGASGGFTWSSGAVAPGEESVQETAYAILALAALDPATYGAEIHAAGAWLEGFQLPSGGWENYAGDGENNEITGEALWAIRTAQAVPEPSTLALLLIGGLGCLRHRRRIS